MTATRLVRIAARSIVRNKLRSLLTMLGIIIGVGAVIVMVAIGTGAQAQIQRQIDGLGTNLIVITPGAASQTGVNRGAGSFVRLSVDDAEALVRESFLASAVTPVIIAPTQIIGGDGNWRTGVMGVNTDYTEIRDWEIESGRGLDMTDVRTSRKVAVLGRTVADALFPGIDPVGSRIQLGAVPFEVIGVLAEKGQTAGGADQDDTILAPYTTVQTRLSGRQFVAQILASATSPADLAAAQTELTAILRETHGLADWEEDDFTVRNQNDIAETAQSTTKIMTALLAAIAGISLIVGGIGIMNIMLVSVSERTREIGIRLAIGARASDVMTQFLVESAVLASIGGLLGVAIGFSASMIVSRITGWSTVISPGTVGIALAFSGSVGVFFGFYPARRAAHLNPIEALRHE